MNYLVSGSDFTVTAVEVLGKSYVIDHTALYYGLFIGMINERKRIIDRPFMTVFNVGVFGCMMVPVVKFVRFFCPRNCHFLLPVAMGISACGTMYRATKPTTQSDRVTQNSYTMHDAYVQYHGAPPTYEGASPPEYNDEVGAVEDTN